MQNKKSDRICEICSKSNDFFEEESETSGDADGGAGDSPVPTTVFATPKLYSQPEPTLSKPKESSTANSVEMVPCIHCTLLNHKVRNSCEACGLRLRTLDDYGAAV